MTPDRAIGRHFLAEIRGGLDLSTPRIGEIPATQLYVQPFSVRTETGATSTLPSTHVDVRPFDVRLGVGGQTWCVRPFLIQPCE
jgi:hypothetical protein